MQLSGLEGARSFIARGEIKLLLEGSAAPRIIRDVLAPEGKCWLLRALRAK